MFFTTYRSTRIKADTATDLRGRSGPLAPIRKDEFMSIVEIEVRGTSTMGFEAALQDAKRHAGDTCGGYVDLDEVARFVDLDGGARRFGVTLKVTCLNKAS